MIRILGRRPSASMLVAITALVLAASGSAVAASQLMSGDKLIKKHSLSGNRLRNHTITGTQVNLNKLGRVPSAKNANTVGGQLPSAFEPASNWMRSGLVKANAGQTVPLAAFGPFKLSLDCVNSGSGKVQAELFATSTEANSDAYGTQMTTAGHSYQVAAGYPNSTSTFQENDDNAADFFTPSGKTYLADLTWGENWLGPATCYANSLATRS